MYTTTLSLFLYTCSLFVSCECTHVLLGIGALGWSLTFEFGSSLSNPLHVDLFVILDVHVKYQILARKRIVDRASS